MSHVHRPFLVVPGEPGANWNTVLGSIAGFGGLYALLKYSGAALPANRLSQEQTQEWNVRIVSTLHALIVLTGALISFVDSRTYTPTELYVGYHWPADIFCRIFLGFILFELGLQTLGSHALRYLTAFLHHIGFAILGFYCIHYSLLPLPFSWLCFGELSTIFLNLRSFLVMSGHKNSSWYKLNGVALAVAFFVARIVVYGWGLWHMWGSRAILAKHGPLSTSLIGAVLVFSYGLNLLWMSYIIKGLWRALVRKEVLHEHDKTT